MKSSILIACVFVLTACSAPVKHHTLRDIDFSGEKNTNAGASPAHRSPDDVRAAYLEYLKHASKSDKSRVDALQRLAQLEFELSEAHNKEARGTAPDDRNDAVYNASLDRSIDLLQTLLRDHPNAENNDKTLYQLAKAYDQKGQNDKSLETLAQLVKRYPKSSHYVESQFRLAERAFISNEYSKAEDRYTDILVSRNNGLFREKSRYKRGWARFKQNYYREAIDDFVGVINMNDFDNLAHAGAAEKNTFDEYFRALGLSFMYLGGPEAMNEYFKENPSFKYIYQAYFRVSDLYLTQERYTDAVSTLAEFNKNHPQSTHLPESALKIIDIWVASGFSANFVQALDDFYGRYHAQSGYWTTHEINPEVRSNVLTSLKDYIVLASAHFHKEYQESRKETAYVKAQLWYERYFKDYQSTSRKDNMHFLYAELLSQHKNYAEALTHYEYAAYDGDIIVNKDAAYATILMTTKLHQEPGAGRSQKDYLIKLVNYSHQYVQLYPGDARSIAVMTHAAEEAYREGMFQQVIDLAELYSATPYNGDTYNIHSIKAHSYYKLERYQDAETAYLAVLQHYKPDPKTAAQINDNLALSIYNQASAAKVKNNTPEALRDYVRISDVVPASDIAATGLYEAIALTFDRKQWSDTVKYIEKFQRLYPEHKLSHDVAKKLSVAYLSTNQDAAAASVLVKTSRSDENIDYKIAALWKAGGLYESKNDYPAAIKTFEEYAATYPRPYPQYMESMQKLSELSMRTQDEQRADLWRNRLLDADKRTPGDLKTDRTNFICSTAALQLGRKESKRYSSIRLALPLNRSLGNKKNALQAALNLYGRAASYGIPETTTEATYAIADLYYSFSRALLDSERPARLNTAELEQYKILLEDQAFPFEDNAIKFYEKNLAHIKQGINDDWVRKSYSQLKLLFPARYNREVMLEPYINVLH
jgi:tetratricopeptide (TPR) repeat protein